MNKEKTCAERVQDAFNSRMDDIHTLYEAENHETPDLGRLSEYALTNDYVKPNTFTDQKKGYHRYQISWGGPSEEFRMYDNGNIEFWFLDWYDGAKIDVTAKRDVDIITSIIKNAL